MIVSKFCVNLSVTFFALRRSEQDMTRNAYRYSRAILMNIKFSRQIFEKYSDIKFHENPSSGSPAVPCRQADRQT